MQPGYVQGATRVLGKSQGYIGLPIRDETIEFVGHDTIELVNQMVSAWFPTPDELAAINAGAPIVLRCIGDVHPPVSMAVGEEPEDA